MSFNVPGDKSISHRAIILSAIADRVTLISNLLCSTDIFALIDIMRELGVRIDLDIEKKQCCVFGVGLYGLKAPQKPLHCGNSGTSMRLLCGLLCAQPFDSVLIGDASLSKRPMLRVATPLRLMGAKINLSENNMAPIKIQRFETNYLKAIMYDMPVASAQVKSAILIVGLYAQGKTMVHETVKTRDHTERMLKILLSSFSQKPSAHPLQKPSIHPLQKPSAHPLQKPSAHLLQKPSIHPLQKPSAHLLQKPSVSESEIKIPSDISSAAFFIVLAAITPNSDITLHDIGINPYRTGIIDILKLMGAHIDVLNEKTWGFEPVADIHVRYAPLRGIAIPEKYVVSAIDEFPAIFVAAVTAKGDTTLRNARELRVKESDRLQAMAAGFEAMGVKTELFSDGIKIFGNQIVQGGRVSSYGDHRIAMAFAIADKIAKNPVLIDDADVVKTSFPEFFELLSCCIV